MIEGKVQRKKKNKGKGRCKRLIDRTTERGWKRGRGQVSDRVRDRVRRRGNESEVEREREREEKGRAKERVSFISAFKSPLGSVRWLGWHILGCCFDSTQHFTRTGRSVALNSVSFSPFPLISASCCSRPQFHCPPPPFPYFSFHARLLHATSPLLLSRSHFLHSVSSVWRSHFLLNSWGWASILFFSIPFHVPMSPGAWGMSRKRTWYCVARLQTNGCSWEWCCSAINPGLTLY